MPSLPPMRTPLAMVLFCFKGNTLQVLAMSGLCKVANKERDACLARGYHLTNKYLGGGAIGRVFMATASKYVITKNMKLQLIAFRNQPLKVTEMFFI